MKRVIMSLQVLTLVVILISMMIGTAICDVQPVKSQSNNSSHSQSSSVQSGPLSGVSQDKSSDTSLSRNGAIASEVELKSRNSSNPDCGAKPCVSDTKAPSSNASVPLPNEAESVVHPSDEGDDLSKKLNPEALMRGFYVFVGLSIIVMAYIAWKSFGKRPTTIHRYGVVGHRDDLEMAPLDSDDGDDDDTTHFDISSHRLQT